MKSFKGKVVWITGASSGLGAALACAFNDQEALVVLSARSMSGLEKTKSICRLPDNIFLLPFDLTEPSTFEEKLKLAVGYFGRLDILVNNAGVSQRSLAMDTETFVYRKIMETNFFGPVALSRLMMKYFRERRSGFFVVISSLTGRVGLPYRTAYCASKFALEGFWSAWATEKRNCSPGTELLIVRPGAIRTPIAENALAGDGRRFNRKDALIEQGIDPDRAAILILKAIQKRRKSLFIGSAGALLLLLLNRYWPSMAVRAAQKAMPGL